MRYLALLCSFSIALLTSFAASGPPSTNDTDIRISLNKLRAGMTREEVFRLLSISPLTLGFGCLHQWHYVVGITTNAALTVSFKRGGKELAAISSLELILIDGNVVFTTVTNISVEMVFRNVGETNTSPVGLLKGLSVVWDGKGYMPDPDPKRGLSYNILLDFQPKHGWRRQLSLSDYLIPPQKLTPGRHTLALREGTSKSNSLTIFIDTPR